jgi:hypothetical protein
MCYESITALAGGDEATLAKSLIISLEDTASNWYLRLPPKCIYSLQQLKEKVLVGLPRIPCGAQHRRRLPIMRSV